MNPYNSTTQPYSNYNTNWCFPQANANSTNPNPHSATQAPESGNSLVSVPHRDTVFQDYHNKPVHNNYLNYNSSPATPVRPSRLPSSQHHIPNYPPHQLYNPQHYSQPISPQLNTYRNANNQSYTPSNRLPPINTAAYTTPPVVRLSALHAQANKENTAPPPAKVPPAKAKGLGSRSGAANRRKEGGSEDEVEKLDSKAKKSAALKIPSTNKLTDEEGIRFVTYATSEGIWDTFRLKALPVCVKMGAELNKTAECLTSYWNGVWERYKACKDAEEHTGGGDGDQSRTKPDETEDDETTDTEGKGSKDTKPKGVKRKRGKTKVRGGKWSQEYLDKFRHGKIYNLIDAVAKNDASVTRAQAFSSAGAVSDDSSDSDDVEVLSESSPPTKKAKKSARSKSRKKKSLKTKATAVGPSSSDGDLLTTALTRISDAAAQRAAREAKESKANQQLKLLSAAHQWSESTNPKVRRVGEKLFLKELAAAGIVLSDSDDNAADDKINNLV
ncbi:hypothetical protein CVT24_002737 [Panaeolus cyanescens]|uniref:No apical meristem-associated C-terminal domain-containing protein n=1 Tax=Panaeolus cyanescens TaxID=181874 RepID=A0A409X1Q7_9AGAR|nr:hypothetical protein CVT24_002737 [Panaeolus cyanescens]